MADTTVTEILGATRVPRKARAIIDGLVGSHQLTPSGLKAAIIATDPNHDTEICSDGWCDASSCRSIVQVVTKTVSIQKPTGGTGAYDAHVFFAPVSPCFSQSTTLSTDTVTTTTTNIGSNKVVKLKREDSKESVHEINMSGGAPSRLKNRMSSVSSRLYFRSTVDSGGVLNQSGSGLKVGSGWNAMTVADGQDWTTASSGDEYHDINLPADYCSGYWRIVGTGVEVVNTTAELYKSGSVTAYRSPSPNSLAEITIGGVGNFNSEVGTLPPSNQPDAALYPNSRTWEAKDGAYQIGTFNDPNNPYVCPVPGTSGLMTPSNIDDLNNGAGWVGYFPKTSNVWASAASNLLPMDVCGLVFAGLHEQSTLQVTTRYYIERHPTIADPSLLVLARTPAPYDPTAVEIISRVMSELPVAVPVGENPMGEWFNDVLEAVADWAPKIGSALGSIGVPLVKQLGSGLGGLASKALNDRGAGARGQKAQYKERLGPKPQTQKILGQDVHSPKKKKRKRAPRKS